MNRNWLLAITFAIHGNSSGMQQQEPPPPPLSPKDANFEFKQCLTLGKLALELDAIYHQTKTLALAQKVEVAYLKAVKCFLEEYEKNKQEALFHVFKMWNLLLQIELDIELEKKQHEQEYKMPSDIQQLVNTVKKLSEDYRSKRKMVSPRKNQPPIHPLPPKTQEQTIKRLYDLRSSLDKLNQPLSPISRQDSNDKPDLRKASLSDTGNLNFRQGTLLYNQAKKAVSLDQNNITIKIEEFFASAENMYIEALQFFIIAYNQNYPDALAAIHKTIKNILDLEQIRSTIEDDAYKINPAYLALQESLIIIKEKEKKRQSEKKLSLPQINPSMVISGLEEAKKLLSQARTLKDSLKTENEQNYTTIESVYLQATQLLFKAHEQKMEDALDLASGAIEECLELRRAKKKDSHVYLASPAVNAAFEQLKNYRAQLEHKNPA